MQGVRLPTDLSKAFYMKVEQRGPDECWLWTGARNDRGYGQLSTRKATHVALELAGNLRPVGALALHSCDNPPCCNPNHLRWGTDAENAADMVQRQRHHANRKTECVRGHPLSGDNLRIRPNGQRACRTCHLADSQKHKAKLRSARND